MKMLREDVAPGMEVSRSVGLMVTGFAMMVSGCMGFAVIKSSIYNRRCFMKWVCFGVFFALLTGCTPNPFQEYYTDRTGNVDIVNSKMIILPEGEPAVFNGSDLDSDYQKMVEDGYILLGYSNFQGANIDFKQAKSHGKKVHAKVVVLYSKYLKTVSGNMPLMLPTTQTTRTNVSGNVSGVGGNAYYSGSGTSTTSGSQPVYVPFNVDRHEYFASYWIKRRGTILGVEPKDITDEIRSEIGSNMGVLVNVVIKNTPAFFSGLFKGDVITSIGGSSVYDGPSWSNALSENAGKEVDVLFFRDGEHLTKKIKLNKKFDI